MGKSKTSSFTLTLKLKTTISDDKAMEKYFELSRRLYNALLGEALKRLNLMRESKLYQKARKETNKKIKRELFKQAELKYKFSNFSLNEYSTTLRVNEYRGIDANTVQALSARAYNSVNDLRFSNGKKVYFIKYGEISSFEGLTNRQGIRHRDGIIYFNKLKLLAIIKSKDEYAQMCLQNRIKFCRILRRQVGNKIRYYVQLVLEGMPPRKLDKEGNFKHKLGVGEVGIDIGTSTVAIVSDKECKLKELAEGLNNIEEIKIKLQRKLDRQKRANNPNKYNLNGTINIYNKNKWIKSNNYIKTLNKLRNIQRKLASQRKQKHEIDANYILSLGNIIKVEAMNFKGLQKHAKNTTINEKTGKYNKKKRFGRTILNKAPAKLLNIINRKLQYQGLELFKINTSKVKASQYNPLTNEYKKKKLSERWNYFNINNMNIEIQRDLMSALIIKNVIIDEDLKLDTINKEKLLNEFNTFKILHDKEIYRLKILKLNGIELLSCIGV